MEKINSLAYSNGKLAISYDESKVAILDVKNGKVDKVTVESKRIRAIQGNHLLIAVDFKLNVVNWKTGEVIFSSQEVSLSELYDALFADEDTVIVSGNSEAFVYKISDDTFFDKFQGLAEGVVTTVHKTEKIIIFADFSGGVHFFRLSDYKRIRRYDIDDQIYEVAVVEDKNALYTWHCTYACKWNLETGEFLKIYKIKNSVDEDKGSEDTYSFYCGALSNTKNILISAGTADKIHLWDTSNGQLIKSLSGHQGGVRDLLVTEDDILYSCGADGKIRRWNLDTFEGEEVHITGL